MKINEWTPCDRKLPPERVKVMTKVDDAQGARNEQPLTRIGNLWISGQMYVYYTPTHWRLIDD